MPNSLQNQIAPVLDRVKKDFDRAERLVNVLESHGINTVKLRGSQQKARELITLFEDLQQVE